MLVLVPNTHVMFPSHNTIVITL